MSEKRKDNKGRILRTGESQRKDLIYQYRYTDIRGKRQTVYSSDLKELREKENRKSTVRPGMFRGFWKSVAGLRCRLALSGYFCMEGKLPMKEIPIWEKSNLSLEEAAAYSGIGINKLREITNEDRCKFVLWVGNKRLIKRRLFDQFIEQAYSI